jgi:hypothetical protein
MVDEQLQGTTFELASRNLPLVLALRQMDANVYDIVKREKLAISAKALASVQVSSDSLNCIEPMCTVVFYRGIMLDSSDGAVHSFG